MCWLHQPFRTKQDADEAKKMRENMKTDMSDMADKVKSLLEENRFLPDNEQLDRDDFIVDSTKYKAFFDQTRQELCRLEEKILARCDKNKIISSRICDEFVDTIETTAVEAKQIWLLPVPKQRKSTNFVQRELQFI